jgi:hypothetical protein
MNAVQIVVNLGLMPTMLTRVFNDEPEREIVTRHIEAGHKWLNM